tara:strand:+ start:266 stop:520 length:255 start_codon:yes stop_codon:yes gene_type:complete
MAKHIIRREVKDNFYNLSPISTKLPYQTQQLAGVISTRQSIYNMPPMSNPLTSNVPRAMQNQPPSTYDNQAITSMDNFTPYNNK